MPQKNHHARPFNESTLSKLSFFEDYVESWLPVFIQSKFYKQLHIFDFFAGPGYDIEGTPGSPIRILTMILKFQDQFLKNNTVAYLHFNCFNPKRVSQPDFDKLKDNCIKLFDLNPILHHIVRIEYYNEDASNLFYRLGSTIEKNPSLVLLDQNGIKFIEQSFFWKLNEFKTTDFLFFVSSSYLYRLGQQPEFRRVIELDKEEIKKTGYTNIHRLVLDKLRNSLPRNSELKLYPFTIKYPAGIYGIIFGTKHLLAVDKFLKISWKRNVTNGEADFDIDEEKTNIQTSLWGEIPQTKLGKFRDDVKELIISGSLNSNFDVLQFCYDRGMLPEHGRKVVSEMKKSKEIYFDSSAPCVSYDSVHKNGKFIKFQII